MISVALLFSGEKWSRLVRLDLFLSVDPLDDVMKDFIMITTANIDIESFVTAKESCPSDFKNESGPVHENENLEEGQGKSLSSGRWYTRGSLYIFHCFIRCFY